MATPKPPLSPQMQDALQRGDIRALLHAARAAGEGVDLPAARRALQQQLRAHAQQQEADSPLQQARGGAQAARDATRTAREAAVQMLHRKRPPTVQMGDRPGEARWILIVAALLALAVWLTFGGPQALPGLR